MPDELYRIKFISNKGEVIQETETDEAPSLGETLFFGAKGLYEVKAYKVVTETDSTLFLEVKVEHVS